MYHEFKWFDSQEYFAFFDQKKEAINLIQLSKT